MAKPSTSKIAPPFPPQVVEQVCRALAEATTGSQLDRLIVGIRLVEPDPLQSTKWKRLYNAVAHHQEAKANGKAMIALIHAVMKPVSHQAEDFRRHQDQLNLHLSYSGLRLADDGTVRPHKDGRAKTHSEAEQRAGVVRTELERRNTHPQVTRYCTAELFAKDNFHAVLEASKGVFEHLRILSGYQLDGASLVDQTLLPKTNPRVAINSGTNESDQSEQGGFANLVKGVAGYWRNPTAHAPRIDRNVTDEELYEAFGVLSLIHRRLDQATVRP